MMNMRVIAARAWLAIAALFPLSASATQLTGLDYTHLRLLTNQNSSDIELGAKSLQYLGSHSSRVFDVAAEVLSQSCSKANSDVSPEAQSWLAKALAKSGDGRYRDLLSRCAHEGANKEARADMKSSLESLPNGETKTFRSGEIDLRRVNRELAALAVKPSAAQTDAFSHLSAGDSLDSVYRQLGFPDQISSISVRGRNHGWGFIKIKTSYQMLELNYSNSGQLRFDLQEQNDAWGLDGGAFAGATPLVGDALLKFNIAMGDALPLRSALGQLAKQEQLDPVLVETVAQRISSSRYTPDVTLGKALAFGCEMVLKSKDGRYRQLMEKISKDAASKELRRHAAHAAEELPSTSEPQFVPVLEQDRQALTLTSAIPSLDPLPAAELESAPKVEGRAIKQPEAKSKAALEERLKTLKRAYDQGLVTKEEYEAKKKELLSEL